MTPANPRQRARVARVPRIRRPRTRVLPWLVGAVAVLAPLPASLSSLAAAPAVAAKSDETRPAAPRAAAAKGAAPSVAKGAPFALDTVVTRARQLAGEPFRDPKGSVPDWLTDITYDQWRDIRFRPDQALWAKDRTAFQVQFFHAGLFYDHPVAIHVVDRGVVEPVPFSPSQFDYGKNKFGSQVPQDLGFAGFRVHYPIKNPKYRDEVIVFLGASYFRALGRDQGFGLSARGLAIDTAESSGEEFPAFREFWLEKPPPGAKSLTILALLDSARATGAYRFVVTPGVQTRVDVEARLFLRAGVEKLGIAPLTSMFFHGENALRPVADFRPEVHDSDGLLVETGAGEWIWRPLDNPANLRVTSLQVTDPKGFGLIQRDRDFDHYQDLEARSEIRPSAWVTPRGGWGKGRVELIEIPTRSDVNDNIVAFWVPEAPPKVGEPFALAYSMLWFGEDARLPPGGRVVATRRDYGTVEDAHRFVIDFNGGKLRDIPAEQVLRGVVTVVGGDDAAELVDQQVAKNPVTGGWRLTFQVHPRTRDPIELRAFLDRGGDTLTETWSATLQP